MSGSQTKLTGQLILVRHGQSSFNADNRFTGWSDPPLTDLGEAEARAVARRLKAADVVIDAAFSSAFERTIQSMAIILSELNSDAPTYSDMALNERSYGDLTGLDKDEASARWGEQQVRTWRRSYTSQPPGGESLRETAARAASYYLCHILPVVLRRSTVLVVSHGNTLRALVTVIEGLSPLVAKELEISTGEILAYDVAFDATIQRIHAFDLHFEESST
ncbi:MAG: 2,3-bisphosphoglycerate-dependent phosphoglycerate mutase [Caulobacteraceae bacterium]